MMMEHAILSRRRLLLASFIWLWTGHISALAQIAFGPIRPYSGAIGRLVSADVDGDMDLDLVSDDGGGTLVTVLLNNGDGTYLAPIDYSIPTGTNALVAVDINQDTHIDLIFARAGPFPVGDGIISILLNDGFGNFGTVIDYAVIGSPIAGQQLTPLSLAAGDFDGDGMVDLAVAAVLLNEINQSGYISIIPNLGNDVLAQPIFGPSVNIDASQSFSRDIVASDFDNDLDIDIAVVSSLSNAVNSVSVILNNGDGTFGAVNNERLGGASTTAFSLIVGEVNGDSFVDLITINGAHTYTVLLNLVGGTNTAKAGQFKDQGQLPLGSQALPATDVPSGGAALRDLDGDGDLELIAGLVGDSGPGSLAVFVNPGAGLFGAEMTLAPCFSYRELVVEDLDGDGDLDVAAGDSTSHKILVLLNELIPAFPPSGDSADSDGDGVLDCVDGCPFDSTKSVPGVCGCAGSFIVSTCDDGDACTTGDVCLLGLCMSGAPTICDDTNICTDDSCNSLTGCLNMPVAGRACDDGDACTSTDSCDALGDCVGGAALNCDDSNVCTDDSCDAMGGCNHVANSAACDDGDACTTGDSCALGLCVSGAATVCDDSNVCTDDSCDMMAGCLNAPVTGRLCDDGDACTATDTCDALGMCLGGAAPNCDDTNECTDDSCDVGQGCLHIANTIVCDDGDACTTGDTCSLGLCISGTTTNCDDGNICTDDSCDVGTGCMNISVFGRVCDDGNACTQMDTCDGVGNCVGGIAPNCDDSNVCTDDSCDALSGCLNMPVAGRMCDDGDACTQAETCDALGVCAGGSALDCDDANVCTDDTCDVVAGCDHQLNAAPCNDGNVCTSGDTCSLGICESGTAINCDDSNVCTDDSCDTVSGCLNTPVVGRICNDGDMCTVTDTCDALGICASGSALDCDDANVCTDDSCDTVTGCNHQVNAAACDDGDACTSGDTCALGLCESGSATVCDDSNVCTDDSCDTVSGCLNTPVVDRVCNDGDVCTETDTCDALGMCVGGPALDCDDINVCTDDSCDSVTGCQHQVNTATCDDGDACTSGDACSLGSCVSGSAANCDDSNVCTDDSCDALSGCINMPIAGRMCDDGDACTQADTCDGLGICLGGIGPNCDDGNECTDDSCDAVIGCVNTPVVDRVCDDGDACTLIDACDEVGNCVGTGLLNCDDSDVCTDDMCDSATGCNHVENTAPCDDGDACTAGDTCSLGICESGSATNCDDSNVCTDDSCDFGSGCLHIPVSGRVCDDGRTCTINDACDANGACVGDDSACSVLVPAMSSWGLAILALLLLTMGTIILTCREKKLGY